MPYSVADTGLMPVRRNVNVNTLLMIAAVVPLHKTKPLMRLRTLSPESRGVYCMVLLLAPTIVCHPCSLVLSCHWYSKSLTEIEGLAVMETGTPGVPLVLPDKV